MSETIIRPATPEDVESMVVLLGCLFSIEHAFKVDAVRQRRGLTMLLESDHAAAWVAEVDGSVVGMITVQQVISTAEGGPAAHVEDLIVAEGSRRQGLGKQLVDTVADWCKARSIRRIQLLADGHNVPAIIFYREMDWKQTNMIALRRMV